MRARISCVLSLLAIGIAAVAIGSVGVASAAETTDPKSFPQQLADLAMRVENSTGVAELGQLRAACEDLQLLEIALQDDPLKFKEQRAGVMNLWAEDSWRDQ